MLHDRQGLKFFSFQNVDVFVSFWYIFLMVLLLFLPGTREGGLSVQGPLLVCAITLSLLVHEFGHAFVAKTQGLTPSIILHGFGGACLHEPAEDDGKGALILFAGPGAGLLFAGLVLALMIAGVGQLSSLVGMFLVYLLWVNVVWSLINLLLPIWPLDGGQLFHLLLRRMSSGQKARIRTLQTSVICTVVFGTTAAFYLGSLYIALMGIFIIMGNIQLYRSGNPLVDRPVTSAPEQSANSFHETLLEKAREAYGQGNWREAYRLGHQIRSSGSMSSEVLREVWELLAVATAKLERYDEALTYAEQIPEEPSTEVKEVRQMCREKLGESN